MDPGLLELREVLWLQDGFEDDRTCVDAHSAGLEVLETGAGRDELGGLEVR